MKQEFMRRALEIAFASVEANKGGPFGAVVVKNNVIVGEGTNVVTSTKDPSAHAEISAIRDACKNLNDYQLTDCEIYTSCEPCPMCLGAIYWARPKVVYYYNTREEAAKIGFDDQYIYDQIALDIDSRNLDMRKIDVNSEKQPFELWDTKIDKIEY
ncbi:nucleoside deaminase [Gracilibacillus salinarum]|uniref:Nucleoside deaminase n=1 Tax=Gracilibacillus salinarum TaxID=2932255 RepID=A0ABY4GQD3_9BACI|nr:nucleoside deaminase [Gracilibacillus salinarum]UOQ86449.1 nucleoside deaminase [Gracilibacillus salinarum]